MTPFQEHLAALLGLFVVVYVGAHWLYTKIFLKEPSKLSDKQIAVIETPGKRCEQCKWFNLQAGQVVLASHPTFMAAASTVTPTVMGGKYNIETEKHERNPSLPLHANWGEFGACEDPKQDEFSLRWKGQINEPGSVGACPNWEAISK